MSEIKVNSIKGVAATTAALSINNTDGTCTANLSNRQGKNLVVNGACLIAQRGTSGTTSGYASVDRFETTYSGTDEAPTQAQHALTSSDTGPWEKGFRYSYHVTNGNQTSGAGAADYIRLRYKMEAQDMAQSGWNYTSSSSFVTLSYWIKASVSQTYYTQLRTNDGTDQYYVFEQALTENTWKKVEHSISGDSDLQFDLNNEEGFYIAWYPFRGTDATGSMTLNQWANWDSSAITPDQTSTWYTTNDATFEITGVQLEVGSVATDFEHRSYGQELTLCQRYYQTAPADTLMVYNDNTASWLFPTAMRAAPTMAFIGLSGSGAALAATANGFRQSASNSQSSGIGYTATSEL